MSPPVIFRTKEVYMILANKVDGIEHSIPQNLIEEPEIWLELLKNKRRVFHNIPHSILTKEMCVLALVSGTSAKKYQKSL